MSYISKKTSDTTELRIYKNGVAELWENNTFSKALDASDMKEVLSPLRHEYRETIEDGYKYFIRLEQDGSETYYDTSKSYVHRGGNKPARKRKDGTEYSYVRMGLPHRTNGPYGERSRTVITDDGPEIFYTYVHFNVSIDRTSKFDERWQKIPVIVEEEDRKREVVERKYVDFIFEHGLVNVLFSCKVGENEFKFDLHDMDYNPTCVIKI